MIPSLQDNLANTVIESMACGTPVVGFDFGGISDMVQTGINGLIVPLRNASSFSGAIRKILDNTKERNRMSKNCRQIAIDEYSTELQSKRYVELYEKLLS